MNIVFKADQIDTESKLKVLSDFISFADDKPEYTDALNQSISAFDVPGGNSSIYKQIGAYYLAKGQKEKALDFYQKGASQNLEDYDLLKNTLLLQIDFKQFDSAVELSQAALEIFPSQALLYLLRGVALNGLKEYFDAISVLEEGVDYVIDNTAMERDFYSQLSVAYQASGNAEKAAQFAKKAKDLGAQ